MQAGAEMAEEKRGGDRTVIVLAALGLLVGVFGLYFAYQELELQKGGRQPASPTDEAPLDVSGAVQRGASGLGVVSLSEGAVSVDFDPGLVGMPMVRAQPNGGAWRDGLCEGDVIIEIDGVTAQDEIEALEGQLSGATTIVVRPRAALADPPGPNTSVRVHADEARRCR